MKIFFTLLLYIIISICFGALSFYLFVFFTWGRTISIETSLTISILMSIGLFIILVYKTFKKENYSKIILYSFILFLLLSIPYYLFFIKDNSKLYQYDSFPCKDQIFSSDYNLTALTYKGISKYDFGLITPYTIEDNYYYDLVKDNVGHTFKKGYNIGSKWTVKGLYHHTRNNISFFLLESIEDNIKVWLYLDHFNYKECKLDFYYDENHGVKFDIYDISKNKNRQEVKYNK